MGRFEKHGRFLPQNPNAPKSKVSYTRNALLPHWIEWRSIVEEFVAAVDAMRIEGDLEPMFTFVTETLGEPWDLDRWLITGDDYLDCELMIDVAAVISGHLKTAQTMEPKDAATG